MEIKDLTLGLTDLEITGSDSGKMRVAAIIEDSASKSVFLWVVTICISYPLKK
jgi:hypothetical protein